MHAATRSVRPGAVLHPCLPLSKTIKPTDLDIKTGDTRVTRVKGDGREYVLNIDTKSRRRTFSYRASLLHPRTSFHPGRSTRVLPQELDQDLGRGPARRRPDRWVNRGRQERGALTAGRHSGRGPEVPVPRRQRFAAVREPKQSRWVRVPAQNRLFYPPTPEGFAQARWTTCPAANPTPAHRRRGTSRAVRST